MLEYFARNPNRLITKQELLDEVWPDTHVTEALVKDYVRKIRRILQDDALQPGFIETARGLGYRLIGNIRVSDSDDALHTKGELRNSVPAIAVLPFADASDGASQNYFATGIAEDIIAELSRFRSLLVIARDSSFLHGTDRLPQGLTVHYLLRGSVRRAGERVRIQTQLIEAVSGVCLWAERYDRELADIFAVQDEVSRSIVSTLVGRLDEVGRQRAARKRPDTLEVYEHLLLANWHLRQGEKEDVLKARQILQEAVDLQPSNARVYTELAFSYLIEFWSGWTPSAKAAAREGLRAARKAVALDDLDSRAHTYLAAAYHYAESNFALAESEYDKAIELNPNDYDGYCLKSWLLALSGQAEQGAACAEKAISLSPLTRDDCRLAQFMGAYCARRYNEALAALSSVSVPTIDLSAYFAMCYAQLGRDAEAKRAMARFLAKAPKEIVDYPGTDQGRWRQYWATRYPFKDKDDFEHLIAGLHSAGLP